MLIKGGLPGSFFDGPARMTPVGRGWLKSAQKEIYFKFSIGRSRGGLEAESTYLHNRTFWLDLKLIIYWVLGKKLEDGRGKTEVGSQESFKKTTSLAILQKNAQHDEQCCVFMLIL